MALDASSVEAKVTAVTRSTFYHLRLIRQLVPYRSTMDLTTVSHASHFHIKLLQRYSCISELGGAMNEVMMYCKVSPV